MQKAFNLKLIWVLFLIVLSAVIAISYISVYSNDRVNDSAKLVNHTNEVLYETQVLISYIKDVKPGSRRFALTDEEEFLIPYDRAQTKVMERITNLKRLVNDNPFQSAKIDSISYYAEKHLDNALTLIAFKRTDTVRVSEISLIRSGKIYMDKVREFVDLVNGEETRLLQERKKV
jgi:CHASE3 domain sensor protein